MGFSNVTKPVDLLTWFRINIYVGHIQVLDEFDLVSYIQLYNNRSNAQKMLQPFKIIINSEQLVYQFGKSYLQLHVTLHICEYWHGHLTLPSEVINRQPRVCVCVWLPNSSWRSMCIPHVGLHRANATSMKTNHTNPPQNIIIWQFNRLIFLFNTTRSETARRKS